MVVTSYMLTGSLNCRNRMDPRMEWTNSQVLHICAYIDTFETDRLLSPVYSVTPNNTLFYTMQKLLASE